MGLSAAGREPHYFGPSSAVSFARIASQSMRLQGISNGLEHTVTAGIKENTEGWKRRSQVRFPSAEEAQKLTTAYFKHIHPQYPFLHRPTFDIWERECLPANGNNSVSTPSPVAQCLVFLVYAIGSLALGQHQYDAAEGYFSRVLDHIGPVLDMDSLESIQAILGCAVYSVRSPVGLSLWKISGMAIRNCIELGYHRSAERFRRSASTLAKEISKRCFWVAYDIDRVVSNILGRPGAISDLSIDAELPMDIDDENITANGVLQPPRVVATEPPTTMTGAIHVIKLRKLWSKYSTHLYPVSIWGSDGCGISHSHSVEELRKELEDWRAAIPAQLDQPSQSNPLSVFTSSGWFQLAYNQSMLLLYRPYITNTGATEGHTFTTPRTAAMVERAFQECYERSKELCMQYRRLYQNRSVQFTWGSLHILFLGGLTYLYCLWGSKSVRENARQADIINTCMACSTVLTIIAERWNLASSYREMFEVLSQRTINMTCNDSAADLVLPSTATGFQDTGDVESMNAITGSDFNTIQPQDFIMGLDEIPMPQESEWLIEELIRSVNEPSSFQSFGMGQ